MCCPPVEFATLTRKDGVTQIQILPTDRVDELLKEYEVKAEAERKEKEAKAAAEKRAQAAKK